MLSDQPNIKWPWALLIAASTFISGCSITDQIGYQADTEIKLKSEVQWQHLNPARGDKAPQAGTLWGDRKRDVATGFY